MSQAQMDIKSGLAAQRAKRKTQATRDNALRIGAIVAFLLVWYLIAIRTNPILLPTPLAVAESLWQMVVSGQIFGAFLTSFEDLFGGLILAGVLGIGIGILMGRYPTIEKILDPFVAFANATPMVAMVPIVIIWFGIGYPARVFFVLILAVWSILVNTLAGIKNVNRGMMEVGLSFGLSEAQIVRSISMPAAIPYILAGVRVGLGKAIVGMIIGEMDIALAGLGGLAATYGDAFRTNYLLAVVFSATVFGVIFVALLNLVQTKWYPWIAGVAGRQVSE